MAQTTAQLLAAIDEAEQLAERFSAPEADGFGGTIGADPLLAQHWAAVAAELRARL